MNSSLEASASGYLASSQVVLSSSAPMTDAQRDLLDREFIKTSAQCKSSLAALKTELANLEPEKIVLAKGGSVTQRMNEQNAQHFTSIVLFLDEYLERLVQLHSRWKLERLQQKVEERVGYVNRPNLSTIVRKQSRKGTLLVIGDRFVRSHLVRSRNLDKEPEVDEDESRDSVEKNPRPSSSSKQKNSSASSSFPSGNAPRTPAGALAHSGAVLEEDQHHSLDAATQELLLRENKQLERQLRTMVDQVKDVETQMMSIATAQAFISSNLSQTKDDLESIQVQAVQIQSNYSAGNTNLQQAAQSGVTFRIFVLMFLLTLSFSLLVMHWTYD